MAMIKRIVVGGVLQTTSSGEASVSSSNSEYKYLPRYCMSGKRGGEETGYYRTSLREKMPGDKMISKIR